MRALVRRIQNRGYATIPRIAEYLMALTAGDESNAVVEAIDAVNMMTVHASKGLEFPIVFVVNLAKGASGPPRPVRVIAGGTNAGDPEPSVTVGPFMSDSDEAERERERHETRRLLYVALTRARDRLYLSSTLKEGKLVAGRGSLAEILPSSLEILLTRAADGFDAVDTAGWTGVSGREYVCRRCRPDPTPAVLDAGPQAESRAGEPSDFGVPKTGPSRIHLSASELAGDVEEEAPTPDVPRSERLFGTLIHRLFESAHLLSPPGAASDSSAIDALAARLLKPEERALLADPDRCISMAAEAWRRASHRDDVAAALEGVERLHEVPFSLLISGASGPQLIRGTIDCLVRKASGQLVVVEIKTGRRRPAHQRQVDLYVRAARALDPESDVAGVLVYV
jgi:ATP-dependent helicase/nuclease subunit A